MYKTIMGRQEVEDGATPEFMAEELQERGLAAGTPEWKSARYTAFRGPWSDCFRSFKLDRHGRLAEQQRGFLTCESGVNWFSFCSGSCVGRWARR